MTSDTFADVARKNKENRLRDKSLTRSYFGNLITSIIKQLAPHFLGLFEMKCRQEVLIEHSSHFGNIST